jgi:protein subunit release factor A
VKSLETRMIEIKAGEGGADSRLFVAELAHVYLKLTSNKG